MDILELGQSEMSRLLPFHGTSSLSMTLRKHRQEVLDFLDAEGIKNVRVFGSVAKGQDGADSDIDLLVTGSRPLGLMAQARLEKELAQLLGTPVDLVFDHAVRPDLKEKIFQEALVL